MEKLSQEILNEFISHLKKNKYKNKIQELKLEQCTDEYGEYIYLVCIIIKKSQRKSGYGSLVLSNLIELADKYNVRIKLYVTNIYGTDLKILYEFYKKHGFNVLKNIMGEYMVYYPKKISNKL